jgi:hypothetical protein
VIALFLGLGLALAKEPPPPPSASILKDKVDLDGNGKPDKIDVVITSGTDEKVVKLTVAKASAVDNQMYAAATARIVDLDPGTPGQELLIAGTSGNGNKFFTFFTWDGHKLVQGLKVDTNGKTGGIQMPGDGTVVLAAGNEFYLRRRAWELHDRAFVEIPQPYFYVGVNAKVKDSLPIWKDPQSAETVTSLKAGIDVEIILVTMETPIWYLVLAPSGLLGWVHGDAIGTALEVDSL